MLSEISLLFIQQNDQTDDSDSDSEIRSLDSNIIPIKMEEIYAFLYI